MSIKIGNISAKDIYIGSTPAKEIRLGSTLIWSRAPEVYYTLTVNFEGDKEAFSDGYKIYVDDMLIEAYRPDAYISFEHSFSIAAGSIILGEMTTMEDYTYSETITPTPASPWIMDKDYSITVVAEKKNYTLTVAYDEGVDYVDIYYKQPNEETFTWRDKTSQVTLLAGSQYYIIPSYKSGYVLDVPVELGDSENPLILTSDALITLYTATSDTPSEQYSLSVINTSYVDIAIIEIKVGDEVVLHKEAGYNEAPNNVEIKHSGQEPISINISSLGDIIAYDWSGYFKPQVDSGLHTYYWTSLPESGTLSISITSS